MIVQTPSCIECGGELSVPDDVEVGNPVDRSACVSGLAAVDTDPGVVAAIPELGDGWGE